MTYMTLQQTTSLPNSVLSEPQPYTSVATDEDEYKQWIDVGGKDDNSDGLSIDEFFSNL